MSRVGHRFWSSLPLLAALAVVGALATPANAAFPGNNGQIATGLGYAEEISSVYPDGSQPGSIVNSGFFTELPRWSPDGTKLLYTSTPGDEDPYQLWAANGDGSGAHLLSSSTCCAAWSPDGTKILFSLFDGIYTANPDMTGQAKIPNTINGDIAAEWAPDGSRIVFINGVAVHTIHPDGTGRSAALATDVPGYPPDWSPDSSKIAFERSLPGRTVWVMNADGTGQTQISATGGAPAWSPDGTKIAFQGSGNNLYTMNPDGTGLKLVTRVIGGAEPDWQPCQSPCQPSPSSYDIPAAQIPYTLAPTLSFSLVPNFRQTISSTQCTARGGLNSTHGAPLSLPSCNPPGFVPGTAAHLGPNTFYDNRLRLTPFFGSRDPASDLARFEVDGQVQDLRTGGGADYDPSPSGPDIAFVLKLRITDSYNGPSQTNPGTASDFDFTAPASCVPNPSPSVGSSCNLVSSSDFIVPDMIAEGKNTVIQVFRLRVNDSGTNGTQGDSDDRTFGTQGIYIR